MSETGFIDDWQNGKSLIDCNLHMLTSEDSYDVTFLVGENEAVVTAHRYVLMSRSCVFHAMLRGPLAERGEVRVPDVPELIFRDFLRFIYTDSVEVTPDNVTGLLYLGKKYAVGSLEKLCLANLESSLSSDSACTILEQAHRFDEEELMSKALDVIVENSEAALMSQEFNDLCNSCVDKVIRSEITADPEQIFTAALSWASQECKRRKKEVTPKNKREALGDAIYHIGFPSMDALAFSKVVVPTKILSDEEHTKIFCYLPNQDTDVTPFKVRERSPGQSKVLFYKGLLKAPEGVEMNETLNISCDHDVSIKGLLVYMPSDRKGHKHKLMYREKGSVCYLVPFKSVSFIKEFCLDEITFLDNIALKASMTYGFGVTSEGNIPYAIGVKPFTPVKVRYGGKNIKFEFSHYHGSTGVIAGIVLADQ